MRNYLMIGAIACSMMATSCTTPGQKTGVGAGIGALAGAAIGSLAYKKDRKKGALIGALAGVAAGGGIGNYLDKQAKELAAVAETKRTENGIVTRLKGDITFQTGKADLSADARSRIAKISQILKKYPANIISVVGHTDSTGSAGLNQRLSESRAMAVKGLMASNGVVPTSLTAMGVASAQPIDSNTTKVGRSKNRRVEINITVPPEAAQ